MRAAAVANEFALLEIDTIRVKGKAEPEVVFTIVGRAETVKTPEFNSLQDSWGAALACYRKQDWGGALQMIEACRCDCERFGLLGLVDAYSDRIRRLEGSPPGSDWDGIYTAETK